MSYYNMICRIIITSKKGKEISFDVCNKVEIITSIKDASYTARVVLPREFNYAKGQSILEYINVGDKIEINRV